MLVFDGKHCKSVLFAIGGKVSDICVTNCVLYKAAADATNSIVLSYKRWVLGGISSIT